MEPGNNYDRYAVAVLKEIRIVGYIPKELSKYCTVAQLSNARITWDATGMHENKIRNSLEYPAFTEIRVQSIWLKMQGFLSMNT